MSCECLGGQVKKEAGDGKKPFIGFNNLSQKTVTCYYCGIICVGTGTTDHVFPKSKIRKNMDHPGGDRYDYHRKNGIKGNRVFACPRCNTWKKDLTIEDFKKTEYYRINCLSRRYVGLIWKKR